MALPRAALALAMLAPLLAGCFGGLFGEARTEWAFEATQLDLMPGLGHTGKGVTIAVLDTGANRGHPALAHLFDGDRANGEVIGFQDFVNGRNGFANAYDDVGHGSHVLGILGASGSSLGDKLVYAGVDLQGGAPEALYLVAKVCPAPTEQNPKGSCDTSAVTEAVKWAASQKAQVISLSLGSDAAPFPNSLLDDQGNALQDAINAAIDAGIVVVASAGNAGPDNTDVLVPSSIPGVLSVGAINKDLQVWDGSSRGDDAGNACQTIPILGTRGRCDPDKKPELVAPGVEILSSWTGETYAKATGTSQACPFVASTVALLLEGRPVLKDRAGVERVKEVLVQTAKHVAGQATPHDRAAGYGIVQAAAALEAYRPA